MLGMLLAFVPITTLAQGASVSPPPELHWLLSPRMPVNAVGAQPEAQPPGLVAADHDAPPADQRRSPAFAFATAQREPEPPGYFSIMDPCAKENLNRNDEPLSQRTNCQGLGIPSGWVHRPNQR